MNLKTFAAILVLSASQQAFAQFEVGPLPTLSACPFEATRSQRGNQIYCVFTNPDIVQAGIGRCPQTPPDLIATRSTVGRNEWCVIKKTKAILPKSKPQSVLGANTGSKCVDKGIDAFHKERGEDAPIPADILNEWKENCKAKGKPF